MSRYFIAILYIASVGCICVALALCGSPYLAFFLTLFLLGNISIKLR